MSFLKDSTSGSHPRTPVLVTYAISVPWFEYPVIYDIRSKPHRLTSPTGTKGMPAAALPSHGCLDLQMVNISLRVLSRPQTNNLPLIYRNLGTDYDERVLPSIVNEVIFCISLDHSRLPLIYAR